MIHQFATATKTRKQVDWRRVELYSGHKKTGNYARGANVGEKMVYPEGLYHSCIICLLQILNVFLICEIHTNLRHL